MQESATVAENNGACVTLRMDAGHHSACGRCGLCSAGPGGDRFLDLPADGPLREAKPGDRVDIELTAPNAAVVALVVFGLPLLGLVAGALVGVQWYADAGLLVGGAVGLGVGAGLTWAVSRALQRSGRVGARVVSVEPRA